MPLKLKRAAIGAAAVALASAAALAGAEQARAEAVMLVYDASGSMRDPLPDGRTRVAVARQVMSELFEGWNPRTPIGLVAYGHRTQACDDVETVLSPGRIDPAHARNVVGQLQPFGMTPLLMSIEAAAEALIDFPKGSSIVAITDGGENCRPEPCAEARRIFQRFGTRVHLVAFDVLASEAEVLACIARETGGEVFHARDAESLAGALGGALSRTGLAGAIYAARLRSERALRLIREGDDKLGAFVVDREAITSQFSVMKDISGGAVDQLAEDGPLWRRLEAMIEEFSVRARETDARAFSTGRREWRGIAAMWAERADQTAAILDDIRAQRIRAMSLLQVVDEHSFVVGQLMALGLADEALQVVRETRDEIAGLNMSLVAVFDEVNAMVADEGVMP